MAKKQNTRTTDDDLNRQSRKDILLARKEARQTRQIRLAIGGVAGLLLLVFLVGIVNEFIIAPNRAIATVNDENITLSDWQDRVRFERAQRILLLENQLEAFGGDVGIIQQFAGQFILELQDTEGLGQAVLDQMVDEITIRQEADRRGIAVSDAEVDKEIGASFNYFDGESPTPFPTSTPTVQPTPSLTPVPTAVITPSEVVADPTPFPSSTPGPSATPRPTATPVVAEVFQEQFEELLARYDEMGVSETIYRESVRRRLLQDKLTEAVANEVGFAEEAEHASFFLLAFDTEEAANNNLALAQADFLTAWNIIRSQPVDSSAATNDRATEVLWRTQTDLEQTYGLELAAAVFSLDVGETSGIIVANSDMQTADATYYLLQVTGREVRPLSDSVIDNEKQQALANLVVARTNAEYTEFWRSRVPTTPVLDPLFLQPPTPTPFIPVTIEPTPAG